MNEQSICRLAPDRAAIERHLDLLFGYLEGFAPVRLFGEVGTPEKRSITPFLPIGPGLAERVERLAVDAAASFHGVYVVPGAVAQGSKAGADDVVASGALLVDLDHGDVAAKRRYLEHHLGAASLVVASGGVTGEGQDRLHLYWRLPEAATGEDLRELIRLRSAVAERAGGDLSFKSVHQPVRVAGSIHGKNGVQRLVRIVEDFAIEYELADLIERVDALPLEPAFAPLSSVAKRPLSTTDIDGLMTSQTRAGGIDGETRFSALSRVIGHWIRQVRQRRATLEQAREAVATTTLL